MQVCIGHVKFQFLLDEWFFKLVVPKTHCSRPVYISIDIRKSVLLKCLIFLNKQTAVKIIYHKHSVFTEN